MAIRDCKVVRGDIEARDVRGAIFHRIGVSTNKVYL